MQTWFWSDRTRTPTRRGSCIDLALVVEMSTRCLGARKRDGRGSVEVENGGEREEGGGLKGGTFFHKVTERQHKSTHS